MDKTTIREYQDTYIFQLQEQTLKHYSKETTDSICTYMNLWINP